MGIKVIRVCDVCYAETLINISSFISKSGIFSLRLPEYHVCVDCIARQKLLRKLRKRYIRDSDDYILLASIAQPELHISPSAAAQYAIGIADYASCGEGLRFRNTEGPNPKNIRIHIEDIPEFIKNVNCAIRQ